MSGAEIGDYLEDIARREAHGTADPFLKKLGH
jgi:hypothetical protein